MKNITPSFFIFFAFWSCFLHPARASDQHFTQLPTALNTVLPGSSATPTPATAPAGDEDDNRGIVKGKVTTADGQAAGSVTVTLKAKGILRSTLTEEDGSFTLRNLPAGSYDVEISLTGFATTTQTITVENKKTTDIAIQLQLSGKQLQEVVVMGGRNKFARSSSNYVAKMPLSNMENPQVYTTITK
ncbi:MAG: carboxypeptidase-like regulatory domain-containing protein, partial [Chitinophaga rupis]